MNIEQEVQRPPGRLPKPKGTASSALGCIPPWTHARISCPLCGGMEQEWLWEALGGPPRAFLSSIEGALRKNKVFGHMGSGQNGRDGKVRFACRFTLFVNLNALLLGKSNQVCFTVTPSLPG